MGLTKIFLRRSAYELLEFSRSRALESAAVAAQSVVRGAARRREYIKMRASALALQVSASKAYTPIYLSVCLSISLYVYLTDVSDAVSLKKHHSASPAALLLVASPRLLVPACLSHVSCRYVYYI